MLQRLSGIRRFPSAPAHGVEFAQLFGVNSWVRTALLLASLMCTAPPLGAECHWWQFRKCQEPDIRGLPDEAPRQGVVITVDVSKNRAYLFQDGNLVGDGPAATGTEKVLEYGDDMWLFHTPRGHLKVLRKIIDPVWTKPDWAFIEAGEPIPPPNSPKREVKGFLGKYALALGEGILIHGTPDVDSLGRRASHGCIRVPASLLSKMWKLAKVGTDVYIFDSEPHRTADRHSDLEFRSR
jgi:hypothetical protein